MLHRRAEGEGGVVGPVPGGEEVLEEEEAPIITTLARGTAMEGEGEEEVLVATRISALVVGVVVTVEEEVVGVAGEEGATEDHNRAIGELPTEQYLLTYWEGWCALIRIISYCVHIGVFSSLHYMLRLLRWTTCIKLQPRLPGMFLNTCSSLVLHFASLMSLL